MQTDNQIDYSKIFTEAKRDSLAIKMSLAGPAGSGKSISALLMALGLTKTGDWSKVIAFDTENSLNLYANYRDMIGNFRIAKIEPPFEPERLVKAIDLAEKAGAEVIICDSLTHFWSGKGGILDINNAYGGKFSDWAKTMPRQNAMVEAIKKSKCHIIVTMRQKTDYIMELNDKGKQAPKKVGLANEQKDSMEYEFTTSFNLDMNHLATASKDRTGIFMDRTPFKITRETGEEFRLWATGETVEVKV